MEYEYEYINGALASKDFLKELSELFSNHYGVWSRKLEDTSRHGKNIKLSEIKLRKWVESDDSIIVYAKFKDKVIGYAIAIQKNEKAYGKISWITQFVVHEKHRNNGIGKRLLSTIWGFSDHYAWGLCTAHPYAIRALEKATHRRCIPIRIKKNNKKLMNFGKKNINYIKDTTELIITEGESKINTEFFVDHSEVNQWRNKVTTLMNTWMLGDIEEGWEWFAFTFKDQETIGLTLKEINEIIDLSDHVAKQAYSRMLLENSSHKWAQYEKKEVQFIINTCQIDNSYKILDIGCGMGRHAIEFGSLGYSVTAVDYVDDFIDYAKKEANTKDISSVKFINEDSRTLNLKEEFDIVTCLYDVIGSFADNNENYKILSSISKHLKKDGYALISVMNYELTHSKAKNFFQLSNEYNKLLDLTPSRTMEQTGDIFDPNYYMIDTETNVIYRKEQFSSGTALPVELIVRDRRFAKDEIKNMCRSAGLKVEWSKYVCAGRWNQSLEPTDDKAKEILLLCKKT